MSLQVHYKNFFKACEKRLFWETERGSLNLYDLFELPEEELKKIYLELKRKVDVGEDPILAGDVRVHNSDDVLRFEIVKDVILYKRERARKNELKAKKKQLEKMLEEIKMRQLQENPEAIMKELERLREQLADDTDENRIADDDDNSMSFAPGM